MRNIINPFTYKYPRLDLHGETRYTIVFLIQDFINDNCKLKNENILIVHGIGSGILRKATHEILSKHPLVVSYKYEDNNVGATVVQIKVDKK